MVFWSSFINKIKTSVSKIDFLKLQNRVDKNETAITNNKTSIDNNRINIDTNRQSIETNATDIDQNKKDIALKADKTELNNYYNKTETDAKLDLKADKADTYTKTEVDNSLNLKMDKTQLNNYYTKTESDGNYYNKTHIDANFYSKAASDARYLQKGIDILQQFPIGFTVRERMIITQQNPNREVIFYKLTIDGGLQNVDLVVNVAIAGEFYKPLLLSNTEIYLWAAQKWNEGQYLNGSVWKMKGTLTRQGNYALIN